MTILFTSYSKTLNLNYRSHNNQDNAEVLGIFTKFYSYIYIILPPDRHLRTTFDNNMKLISESAADTSKAQLSNHRTVFSYVLYKI